MADTVPPAWAKQSASAHSGCAFVGSGRFVRQWRVRVVVDGARSIGCTQYVQLDDAWCVGHATPMAEVKPTLRRDASVRCLLPDFGAQVVRCHVAAQTQGRTYRLAIHADPHHPSPSAPHALETIPIDAALSVRFYIRRSTRCHSSGTRELSPILKPATPS